MSEQGTISRRQFLVGSLAAGLSIAAKPVLAMTSATRSLKLRNLHTGERTNIEYYANGEYIREALSEVDWILRDHRTNQLQVMDLSLMDWLHTLQQKMESNAYFEIISGFRSPETNAKLLQKTEGVNPDSLHMQGRAIDIRLPGRSTYKLFQAAESMQRGGVGYYPRSNFVHLEGSPVNSWIYR
jgi:uncharacterized protein YcbK (DUF882 family)